MSAFNASADDLQLAFSRLSKKISDMGYRTRIDSKLSVLEFTSHVVLHLVFLFAAVYYMETLSLFILFMFLMMLSGIGITTGTHTASHYSLVKNRKLNEFIVYLGYGFFFGASREYWMHKHIRVHHPNPNIVGIDEDINLMPWFAMNCNDIEKASTLSKLYYRLQFLIIPFALTFNLFNVQKDSLMHLFKLIRSTGINKRILIDFGVMSSHFICWIVIPSLFFNLSDVLLIYFIRAALIGYGMFAAFAPAHFPSNALFLTTDNNQLDFAVKQIYTTTNFTTGIVGRYILGGVQYQIEHHLFPKCHHYHYPEINVLLRQFCKDNGLPYNEISWFNGIWQSLNVFRTPKPVYNSPA